MTPFAHALNALLVAALAVAPAAVAAPLPWRPLVDQNSVSWSSRDGLPHNQINALAQTGDGLIWVGTYEGLARFDGMAFTVLRPENTPGFADAGVRDLHVDSRGRLFAALGRGGVSVLDGGRWQVLPGLQPAPGDQAVDVLVDTAGRLWVGYDSGELHRVDADGAVQDVAGLPGGSVRALLADPAGAVWVGTNRGLARVDGAVVRRFGIADGLPERAVTALTLGEDGSLRVATDQRLWRFDGERFAAEMPVGEGGAITAMVAQGDLVVAGTASRGLLRMGRSSGVEVFGRAGGLVNDRVVSLLVDRERSLWVGTSRGLQRFAAMPVRNVTTREGLGDAYVRTLLELPDGRLYIGGVSGLYLWREGRAEPILDEAGRPLDSVLSLAADTEGGVWVGTYTAGIRRLRDGRIEPRAVTPQVPPGAEIRGLLEDRPGRLWVGTNVGLFRVEGGALTAYTVADGLPSEHVRRLLVDRRGVLWVATNHGLARFEQERFQAIDVSAANDARTVFAMYEDAEDALWLATDRGLVRYRADAPVRGVATADGLPPATLFEVTADTLGNLWLDSNRGVSRISAASLASWEASGTALEVLTLDEASGMVTAQASGGAGPAMLQRRKSGEVWVALAGGIARVDPRELDRLPRLPPRVVVQGVRVDNREVPALGRIDVAPEAMRVEIDYVSPTFLTPRGVTYRHRLLGFEDDWVVSERAQRVTQYTNLPAGRYRFEVEASYDAKRWSDGDVVEFDVRVRWWRNPGAWAAVALLLGAVGLGMFRWRLRLLKVRQRELRAVVDSRTRELAEKARALEDLNRRIRSQSASFEAQAMTDPLTGLPNRRAFEERVKLVLATNVPVMLGLLDIDHFKRINDTWSHEAGDRVLELVAEALRHETGMGLGRRHQDPFVARWGGEEFALFWPSTDAAAALQAAGRLRDRVAALDFGDLLGGQRVTVSIGLAASAAGRQDPEALLRLADERLYAAKAGGRNRVEI